MSDDPRQVFDNAEWEKAQILASISIAESLKRIADSQEELSRATLADVKKAP